MPLPKNCNDPAVRAAWIAEREAIIAEYERLVAGGQGMGAAARSLGTSIYGIEMRRASVERLRGGGGIGRAGSSQIDLGLALLSCLRRPGETLSLSDIAAWCGCSRNAIWLIEQSAIRKARKALVAMLGEAEMAGEIADLPSFLTH